MRPYSNDLRSRVVAAMQAGGSCRDVGAPFGVAPSTAGNWHRQYRRTQSYAPLAIGGDRRSKLTQEADWIAARLVASRVSRKAPGRSRSSSCATRKPSMSSSCRLATAPFWAVSDLPITPDKLLFRP